MGQPGLWDSGFRMCDMGFGMRNVGLGNTGFGIRNAWFGIWDVGSLRMWDLGCGLRHALP